MPARKILILQEVSQYRDVTEATLDGVMDEGQPRSVGGTRDLEGLDEGVIYGVIQNGVQCSGTLVLRRKVKIVSVHFAETENASTGAERAPEITVHVFGSVNAEAINRILLDKILDPACVNSLDLCVLCIQVRERDFLIAQPAVHLALSISPNNGTIGMVLGLVLKHVLGKIWSSRGSHNVVNDNVNHKIHISAVNLCGKGFEVVGGTKTGIQLGRILDPVPMIWVAVGSSRAFIILVHRTDPNRSKTCVLDVVEVFPDGIPISAAPGLVLGFTSGWIATSWKRITVGNNLVYGA